MNFEEIFSPERMALESKAAGPSEALAELCALIGDGTGEILELVEEREEQVSTGIGNGVAIPHCRSSGIKKPVGGILRLKPPIDFGAIDGKKVGLFFLIVGNGKDAKAHIKILAKISRFAKVGRNVELLTEAGSPEEFMNLLKNFEN